ncbi:hypothetical protein [Vibrio crassostreae]|uniref:hypothetical protein n=1 Tax=Vibrio crassostreae TaxID=246167 RepID=UPI001B304A10|nr:hypothetical protein [Vibrio crassostreae]
MKWSEIYSIWQKTFKDHDGDLEKFFLEADAKIRRDDFHLPPSNIWVEREEYFDGLKSKPETSGHQKTVFAYSCTTRVSCEYLANKLHEAKGNQEQIAKILITGTLIKNAMKCERFFDTDLPRATVNKLFRSAIEGTEILSEWNRSYGEALPEYSRTGLIEDESNRRMFPDGINDTLPEFIEYLAKDHALLTQKFAVCNILYLASNYEPS